MKLDLAAGNGMNTSARDVMLWYQQVPNIVGWRPSELVVAGDRDPAQPNPDYCRVGVRHAEMPRGCSIMRPLSRTSPPREPGRYRPPDALDASHRAELSDPFPYRFRLTSEHLVDNARVVRQAVGSGG